MDGELDAEKDGEPAIGPSANEFSAQYTLEACGDLPTIDLLKTPLAALIGARSPRHAGFFTFMRRYYLKAGSLYRVGALLAMVVIVVPRPIGVALAVPAGLMTLPSWILMALTLGSDMLSTAHRQFDFWYFTVLNVATWSLLASMYADLRVLSLVGGFLGTQSTIFIDANFRTVVNTLRSCVVAVPAILLVAVMTFFRLIDTDELNYRSIRIKENVTVDVTDICANAAATLAVFVARKAYNKRKCLTKNSSGLRVIRCVVLRAKLVMRPAHPSLDAAPVGGNGALNAVVPTPTGGSVTELYQRALHSRLLTRVTLDTIQQVVFRDVLRALLRNFDFLFMSAQFTVAMAMLCDMMQWTTRSLAVLAWFVWFQTVLVADAVTPPVRRALGVRKRFTALPLALSVSAFVALAYALLFQDTALLADRTLVSMSLGSGHGVSMGTKSVLLNRLLTLVVWSLRLLWDALSSAEAELTFLRGSLEYYTPLEMFPPVSEVAITPLSILPAPAADAARKFTRRFKSGRSRREDVNDGEQH